jgi:hypothetical protein
MKQTEEFKVAQVLAKLKIKNCSVFAHYDFLAGKEIFKGIFISPAGKEAADFLKKVIEIITTYKGLGGNTEKPK